MAFFREDNSKHCIRGIVLLLVNEANPCGGGDDIADQHVTQISPRIWEVGYLDMATIWWKLDSCFCETMRNRQPGWEYPISGHYKQHMAPS